MCYLRLHLRVVDWEEVHYLRPIRLQIRRLDRTQENQNIAQVILRHLHLRRLLETVFLIRSLHHYRLRF